MKMQYRYANAALGFDVDPQNRTFTKYITPDWKRRDEASNWQRIHNIVKGTALAKHFPSVISIDHTPHAIAMKTEYIEGPTVRDAFMNGSLSVAQLRSWYLNDLKKNLYALYKAHGILLLDRKAANIMLKSSTTVPELVHVDLSASSVFYVKKGSLKDKLAMLIKLALLPYRDSDSNFHFAPCFVTMSATEKLALQKLAKNLPWLPNTITEQTLPVPPELNAANWSDYLDSFYARYIDGVCNYHLKRELLFYPMNRENAVTQWIKRTFKDNTEKLIVTTKNDWLKSRYIGLITHMPLWMLMGTDPHKKSWHKPAPWYKSSMQRY
jgi:hypothetical protein